MSVTEITAELIALPNESVTRPEIVASAAVGPIAVIEILSTPNPPPRAGPPVYATTNVYPFPPGEFIASV